MTGEPLYALIHKTIKADIFAGNINPGDMLPSETLLMERYGASRDTIRKGLKHLENLGLVYAWPGKGYYVAKPEHDIFTIHFSEDVDEKKRYHAINVRPASDEVREALQLQQGKQVITIGRVIHRQGKPVSYEVKYLPYDKGAPIIETEIEYAVFPEIAAAKTAPFAFYTEMEIGAEMPPEEVVHILGVGANDPVLVMHRVIIGHDSQRIGYGKKYLTQGYGRLKALSGYGKDV